jgi:hypothetical protein
VSGATALERAGPEPAVRSALAVRLVSTTCRQTYVDAEATLEKNASPGAAQKPKSYGFLEWPALMGALDRTDVSYRE